MARATGIEIGETAVAVVELEGSPKKFRVAGAARVRIEETEGGEDRLKAAAAALKQALRQSKARREQVVLSVRSGHAVIREISLPFTDLEQIRKVIKFESESHLHSCDIDDVVVGFHKTSEAAGRSRVLIFAVRKTDLRDALDVADRCGVDPLHVTLDAAGLFNLWRALPPGGGDAPVALAEVDDKTTTAVVAVGDRVRLVRTIRLGVDSVARGVAAEMGVDEAKARRESKAYAEKAALPFGTGGMPVGFADEPAGDLKREIVREGHGAFATKLAGELRRSASSVLLDGRLQGVWLTGVGARTPGLEGALAEEFGVPVKVLDPLEGVEHRLKPEDVDGLATGAGLALAGLGQDALGLDFRQEEFRFSRKFDRVKTPLSLGLLFLFGLLAFLCIGEHLESRHLKEKQQIVGTTARTLARNHLLPLAKDPDLLRVVGLKGPDEIENLLELDDSVIVARLINRASDLSDNISENYGWKPGEKVATAEKLTTSAMTRLAEWIKALSRAKAGDLGPFTIEKLRVTDQEVTWDMDVQDSTRWAILDEEFSKLEGAPKATRGSDRPSQSAAGMRRFEQCKLEWPRKDS
ncbi:MAG TPA: pilus assembly protein PilM [Planctomycetota bacterium]|nr:pilus assembly protein PilM [Planctomycetota bacterium]